MSSRFFRIGRSVTGLGLFATRPIKRGVYIATYRGRRITTEEADRREARGAKFQFEINKRWTIDGSPRVTYRDRNVRFGSKAFTVSFDHLVGPRFADGFPAIPFQSWAVAP